MPLIAETLREEIMSTARVGCMCFFPLLFPAREIENIMQRHHAPTEARRAQLSQALGMAANCSHLYWQM